MFFWHEICGHLAMFVELSGVVAPILLTQGEEKCSQREMRETLG